jgi:hypothetical protein
MEKVLKIEDKEKERPACACCGRDDLSLMDCAACGTAKYCSGTCQKTAWPEHKATCKTARKAREHEAARASGLKDMGSILNTLNMQAPLPKNTKYWEGDLYDACRFVRAILYDTASLLLYDHCHIESNLFFSASYLFSSLLLRCTAIPFSPSSLRFTARCFSSPLSAFRCAALLYLHRFPRYV